MAAHSLKQPHWRLSSVDDGALSVMQRLTMLDYPSHPPDSQWTEPMPDQIRGVHGGARADVFQVELDGKIYCVKRFHDSRLFVRWRGKLGYSKASRAFENGQRLLQMGIPVPAMIGLAVHRKGAPALLVTEMLGSGETVRDLFWMKATDQLQLKQRCEAFTRQLAESGVLHLDYGPRNILHFRDQLYLIDLEDVRFSRSERNLQRMNEQFEIRQRKDAARVDRYEPSGVESEHRRE